MRISYDVQVETMTGYRITRSVESDGRLVITIHGGKPLGPNEMIRLLEVIGEHLETGDTPRAHINNVDTMSAEALHDLLNRQPGLANLSRRAANIIDVLGCPYVGNLVQVRERILLKTRNCGRGTVREIKQYLEEMGLRLGMTLEDLRGWQRPHPPSP